MMEEFTSFTGGRELSPGHESANLGPSALCNEESDNRVCDCTPGFTNEQHHGRLEGVDLQSRT